MGPQTGRRRSLSAERLTLLGSADDISIGACGDSGLAYGLPVAIRFDTLNYTASQRACIDADVGVVDNEGAPALLQSAESISITSANSGVSFHQGFGCFSNGSSSITGSIPARGDIFEFSMTANTRSYQLEAQSTDLGDAVATLQVRGPCAGVGQGCGGGTLCCSGLTCNTLGAPMVCQCNLSGCIPAGQSDCGSSASCCSGAISGSTCF